METKNSEVSASYKTIKLTKSRINKGLLAIPVSLIDLFPKEKTKIKVLLNDIQVPQELSFTPYTSSSREIRIGGLGKWYLENNLEANDEIVIQVIDGNEPTYRLYKETLFVKTIKDLSEHIIEIDNDNVIENSITKISSLTEQKTSEIYENKFIELVASSVIARKIYESKAAQRNETTSSFVKNMLLNLYDGHCQLTDFTFIQRNGKPYFEIHHIDDKLGNHPKNLLVVSPNIHCQFTYRNAELTRDSEGWLREVKFSGDNDSYAVNQQIDRLKGRKFTKEIHF
ncbi:MAG: HNH endonuclease [Ignavibacteria bacterium]|jgi:hypothetical protein|nr:HNH endonuclease [Ignavibacteria bacterium]